MISPMVNSVIEALRNKGKLGKLDHQSGSNRMYSCPFKENHGGREQQTVAFGIHEEQGWWNCFSCGAGSQDIMDLYTKLMGVTRFEAKENLGSFEISTDLLTQALEELDEPFYGQSPTAMVDFPDVAPLIEYPEAVAYLESRNIPRHIYQAARLSFFPGQWMPAEDPSKINTMPGRRIIFPLLLPEGMGFSGRVIDKDKNPKYYRPIKNVRGALYNPLNISYRETPFIFVVEGEMDCLACMREGLPTVALMGSNLSKQQAGYLAHFRKVYFLMDGDKAGDKAVSDAIHTHGNFIKYSVVRLGKGDDPGGLEPGWADSIINSLRQSQKWAAVLEEFQKLIKRSVGV